MQTNNARTKRARTLVAAMAATLALTAASAVPAAAAAPDEVELHQQLWSAVAAQPQLRTAPEATPAERRGTLDSALQQVVDSGSLAVSARVESGELTWAGADGVRREGTRAPARTDSAFRAASISKMLISTLVLQQVAAGTFELDTTVGEIDPTILPNHPQATLRQLLSHTSGMPYGTDQLLLAHMEDPTSIDDLTEAFTERYAEREHLAVADGEGWVEPGTFVYSNVGYVVLGAALESATGRDLGEMVLRDILDPLDMDDSRYAQQRGMRGTELRESMWDGEAWHDLRRYHPSFLGAAAGLVASTEDLSTLTEAIVTGRIVPQHLVAEMLTPVTPDLEYGLGIYRVADPCTPGGSLYGHDGAATGTLSIAYSSPDGSRQVSLGVTGRDYSGEPTQFLAMSALLATMLQASC